MLFSKEDLRKLLIPLLFEQFLAVLIGVIDTMMVASCGEAAVSGVSLVDSINVLLINIFSALATGGAVVAAQYLGRGEPAQASKAAKQLFYVSLIVSTSIMVLCLLVQQPLLRLIFGTIEPEVMSNAQTYFFWSLLSYPFLAMYNASAALLRSMGNSKASLETSVVMNLTNLAGNALLIYVVKWGVAGAAISTLFSRALGAVLMQRTLRRPENSIPCPALLRFEWHGDMVGRILSVGIPTGMENSLFQLGKLLLLGMISTFGTTSIAANAVGNSFATLQALPGIAVGLGMVTVVGRCIGAGEFEQAKQYTVRLMKLAYLIMAALNLLMLACSSFITKPFGLSPEADALARQIVCLHGIGCVTIWPLSFVLPNALRAANDAKFTMLVSCFSMVMFRMLVGYLLASVCGMGVIGVWIAMQVDWVFRIICFVTRYRSGKWLTKKLI